MPTDPLARYWSILDGDSEPRYLESKRIMLDVDLEDDTNALWRAHESVKRRASSEGGHSLLDLKIELAGRMLRECSLCERMCGVDRSAREVGHCGVRESRVSSEFLHMGEEPVLIPSHTIFFSGCTFDCVFCQNWDISTRPGSGLLIEPTALAEVIARRARPGSSLTNPFSGLGARNVNWVGGEPTSHLGFILRTLKESTTTLPQVWNSNMYLSESSMRLLDGVVDVYLTDFKYGNDRCAKRLSGIDRYLAVTERNHRAARSHAEMIIRHLVLPSHTECCTKPILRWISENLDAVTVNVMAQYRPAHRAAQFPEISRPLKASEFEEAVSFAEGLGLDLCD